MSVIDSVLSAANSTGVRDSDGVLTWNHCHRMFHPSLVISPTLTLILALLQPVGRAGVFMSPDQTIDGRRVMRRY